MKRTFLFVCMAVGATSAACGAADDQGDSNGAGGTGASAGGAVESSGGAPQANAGGRFAGGGTMGGATPTGGSSSGGASPAGGAPGSGGSSSAGGASSSGGATGMAGAGGSAGSSGAGGSGSDDPCAGGTSGPASDAPGAQVRVSGYGGVQLVTSTKTQITSLETTLEVPLEPKAGGTLFIWPGLEPLNGSMNYRPIGTGVLQPVLTWGGTCAPGAPNDYVDWWISGQYVNTLGNAPGFTGCKGGDGMRVSVGDKLHILMSLNGTTWSQSITDEASGKEVSFDFDLKGQGQNWVIYSIETPTGREPVSDVVFTSTVMTTADADPAACAPSLRGTNDYFSAPRSSADGRRCCISKIILRGQGVPPSGPND